jgi:hypothetical protein
MPTILRPPFAGVPRSRGNAPAARLASHLRRSRALASLLPALLTSGAVTLAMTFVILVMCADIGRAIAGSWTETWLTSWAFAFPLTYLVAPLARRLGARLAGRPQARRR